MIRELRIQPSGCPVVYGNTYWRSGSGPDELGRAEHDSRLLGLRRHAGPHVHDLEIREDARGLGSGATYVIVDLWDVHGDCHQSAGRTARLDHQLLRLQGHRRSDGLLGERREADRAVGLLRWESDPVGDDGPCAGHGLGLLRVHDLDGLAGLARLGDDRIVREHFGVGTYRLPVGDRPMFLRRGHSPAVRDRTVDVVLGGRWLAGDGRRGRYELVLQGAHERADRRFVHICVESFL